MIPAGLDAAVVKVTPRLAMCSLILLLPIIALPVLWLLLANDASGLYAGVVLISTGVYWLVPLAMRAPVVTGLEALSGAIGSVRSVDRANISVWVASEFCCVEPTQGVLRIGDVVAAVGAEGLAPKVTTSQTAR